MHTGDCIRLTQKHRCAYQKCWESVFHKQLVVLDKKMLLLFSIQVNSNFFLDSFELGLSLLPYQVTPLCHWQ